jgi:hypothetical protein
MTLSRKTRESLARVMIAAIIATALMLLMANAMLIGHSVYKIVLLGDIADLEQRWIAKYTPMRSLMVGVWGIACGLSAGVAALVAHRAFPASHNSADFCRAERTENRIPQGEQTSAHQLQRNPTERTSARNVRHRVRTFADWLLNLMCH